MLTTDSGGYLWQEVYVSAVTRRRGTSDGGEFTWEGGVKLTPVGDHGMPARVTYRHEGGPEQPGCVIDIEVWEGVPVCARAELVAKDGVQVRPKHLKDLAGMVDPVIETAGVVFGFTRNGETGWGQAYPGSVDDQRARLHSVRASRRAINSALLERVSEVYREASKPKLEAVAAEFNCSERSAARYVTAARKEGLLDG